MNTKLLSQPLLESMLKQLPSEEEIRHLEEFRNSPDELGKADQFCLAISDIPALEAR